MKLHATPFLGSEYSASLDEARVVVLPVPYEGGVSYGGGTGAAPQAVLDASSQLEVYDSLLQSEPWRAGIATVEAVNLPPEPEHAQAKLRDICGSLLDRDKFVVLLGGDHSLSPALCAALADRQSRLSVVQFDAHADLRQEYEGSRFSHACAVARMRERTTRTLQVGIRSMAPEEAAVAADEDLALLRMTDVRCEPDAYTRALDALTDPVFLTFDVDVLDWSVVWSTGTPEPGGLLWDESLTLLHELFRRRQVAAFDMVELAVRPGDINSPFAVAKLIYHLIGLATRTLP
jgi:agmatinase